MTPASDLSLSGVSTAHDVDAGGDGVAARLHAVRRRLRAAASRAGVDGDTVTIVAVSKTFGAEAVLAARRAGQVDFGESRVQELVAKSGEVGDGIRWHFVGRLQRNKAADAVARCELIHSVDRLHLAREVATRARRASKVQRVLLQVDVGEDPDKGGCPPAQAPELLAALDTLAGVECVGLMTIPPLDADPRPLFRRLRQLRDQQRERFPRVEHLSMGMTHDFEIAVEEGATIVRVGEAVFGPRPPTR